LTCPEKGNLKLCQSTAAEIGCGILLFLDKCTVYVVFLHWTVRVYWQMFSRIEVVALRILTVRKDKEWAIIIKPGFQSNCTLYSITEA